MKNSRLFLLTLKRYLKKPAMLILLAVFPLLTVLLLHTAPAGNDISAAVFIETTKEDAFVKTSFQNALLDYQGQINFVLCDSKEDMTDMVINRKAECGYLIPADFYTRIFTGEDEEIIEVTYAPSTTLMPLINESLFSVLYTQMTRYAIADYLLTQCEIRKEIAENYSADEIIEIYQEKLHDGSTFHFQQEKLTGLTEETKNSFMPFEVLRGMLSIFILLSSLTGLLDYYRCSKNILFQRPSVRVMQVAVPTILSTLAAFICLCFSPLRQALWKEAGCLLLYCLLCIMLTLFLGRFIRKANIFYAFLPLYLIANLLLCPVIADLGSLLPMLRILSYFFLPTYYLRLF